MEIFWKKSDQAFFHHCLESKDPAFNMQNLGILACTCC